MKDEKLNKEIFINDFKEFERLILSRYNPRSEGTSPQIGIVKLYEVYLKNEN